MSGESTEVQRTINADAATIFRVLCDPLGHVAIDSSGMLQDAGGEPITKVGEADGGTLGILARTATRGYVGQR